MAASVGSFVTPRGENLLWEGQVKYIRCRYQSEYHLGRKDRASVHFSELLTNNHAEVIMVIGPPSVYYHDMMARRGSRGFELPQEHKLFVGGLSWNTSDQKLRDYFSHFGEVCEAYVAISADKTPRGFGFVSFYLLEVADRVCSLSHTIDERLVRGGSEQVLMSFGSFWVYSSAFCLRSKSRRPFRRTPWER